MDFIESLGTIFIFPRSLEVLASFPHRNKVLIYVLNGSSSLSPEMNLGNSFSDIVFALDYQLTDPLEGDRISKPSHHARASANLVLFYC